MESKYIALLQEGESIIEIASNQSCCDTCTCEPIKEKKFNKLLESQTSFEE